MKSGQVYSQALIYIFTLVLVSIILIYGHNAISSFRERASEVSMLKLRNDISNSIQEMASEYRSEKLEEFLLPNDVRKVCFVETYDGAPTEFNNVDILLRDSVETGSAGNADIIKIRNVFFIDNSIKDSFNVPVKIDVQDGFSPNNEIICKENIGGRFSLKIVGKGDGVELS